MPSEWIPALWGGPGNEPEWESEDEFQRFFRLVMQHMNYIATMLMDHPEEFEALYLQAEMNGKTYNIVGEWCEGYLKGVSLSSNAWLQLPKRIIENHLSVMQIFASDEHIDELKQLSEEGVLKLQDKIEPAVRTIHAYFLERRSQNVVPFSDRKTPSSPGQPKVGRNDICSCGSGLKYKKCCLH